MATQPTAAIVQEGHRLAQQGRFKEAGDAYRRALKAEPDRPDVLYAHGYVLAEQGLLRDAVTAYRKATRAKPDFVEGWFNLGATLEECGEHSAAVEAYRRTVALAPGFPEAHVNLGNALSETGKHGDAVDAYRTALALIPDHPSLQSNFASALLLAGDSAAAEAACEQYLPSHPHNTILLATQSLARYDLKRDDGGAALLDYERFLMFHRLDPPAGYASMAEFNAALSAHVETHPTLSYELYGKSNRKASTARNLLAEPLGPMAGLLAAIRSAVAAYVAAHPADPGHPFLAAWPPAGWRSAGPVDPLQWQLDIWGTLAGREGHQTPHIHPEAWLSGVYYPRVPEVVGAKQDDHAGWVEFGPPGLEFSLRHEPPRHPIQPEEGLMILFPSYCYHRTIPFEGGPVDTDETRISIAFDLGRPPAVPT